MGTVTNDERAAAPWFDAKILSFPRRVRVAPTLSHGCDFRTRVGEI